MKNFDEAREARAKEDRSFQLGGEVFTRKVGIRPEVLSPYENLSDDTPATEALATIDMIVLDMIEDGGEGQDACVRYKALRAREDDPVTLGDLTDLVEWLVESATSRPTSRQSGSMRGPAATGTISTEGSSSPGAKRAPKR